MDPASLIIPFLQTSTELISPTPLPPPSNPTLIPSLITPDSQNIPMSGVVRNKAGAGAQPPRPPNAWILYRSDKLQELPPPPVGQSKLTQAQVSKIIAAEWKKEPEEVRNFYEQRAEKAKAEHARLYPNYRFAPMKKVDRDRIREERRQAKELERVGRRVRGRVAPYPPPTTSSTTFNLPGPLIIKHVLPHAPSASPTISSHSSSSSATLLEQPRVSVEPFLGSTRVSPNASPDLHFPFVDLQDPPSHESSPLGDTPPSETSQPAFLLRPMHPPSLPNPPRGWNPSSSDPPTTFIDPSQDVSLPDWLQTLPQIPKQACIRSHISLPGLPNVPHRLARPTFGIPCLTTTISPSRNREMCQPSQVSTEPDALVPSNKDLLTMVSLRRHLVRLISVWGRILLRCVDPLLSTIHFAFSEKIRRCSCLTQRQNSSWRLSIRLHNHSSRRTFPHRHPIWHR